MIHNFTYFRLLVIIVLLDNWSEVWGNPDIVLPKLVMKDTLYFLVCGFNMPGLLRQIYTYAHLHEIS